MEVNGSRRNILETTVSYKAWARLTPTLTHVVTYELVTSGAKDDAMSIWDNNHTNDHAIRYVPGAAASVT